MPNIVRTKYCSMVVPILLAGLLIVPTALSRAQSAEDTFYRRMGGYDVLAKIGADFTQTPGH